VATILMTFLRISQNYHFGLHILPPGLHKIGWTARLCPG